MNRKKLFYIAVVLTVLIIAALSFYQKKKEKESVVYSQMLMGTIVQMTLSEGDEKRFDRAAEAAFTEIKRLEEIFSSYKPESDASRVSKAAGSAPVKVSPEFIEVLKTALYIAEFSGGAFDPTVGALGKLWGYSGERGVVPTKEEAARVLPLVDYRNIILDAAAGTVMLRNKGMVLNLGGVSKGYIVRRAIEALKKEGVTRGIMHAGGDMAVFQTGTDKPFIIGIQHPREKGKLIGEAYVERGAIATSGDYERVFIINGVRYHHILDPSTGFPADKSMSVTIIAEDSTLADALSTAVFVMGPQKGMELIEKLDKVEGVIVDKEGNVAISSGFKGKIQD